ncbi:helix-turn-helix transcriptional regulator [Chondrinema litorale]|uniref:helix-turn-helix transcriptional regulator n=1 Tax=Chondrinema litorale TaxID=2994555 RepID=UPI0025435C27|nr:WYL domain-containing protein [Chondrinema litorale]UZR96979.1 WYL domain-containing protein [Chondrinema litorale]
MKRLERLTALLTFLQSKKFTSLKEIEAKFNVSERTVFRDLKSLEEAKSFIFVEQLARKFTDKETFQNFSSALEKIKNKLRDQQLTDIEKLAKNVEAYINEKYLPKYLSLVEEACTKKQVLKINYCDAKGNTTERLVEPIGITFYYHNWHLIGYCRLRNNYRDFSLARVIKITNTIEHFSNEHISLTEYIRQLENS